MKLNSTGSFWTNGEDYFSYRQQMTCTYNGYKLFDGGRWSATTAKHQAKIRCMYKYDIVLYHADFNRGAVWSLKNEISNIDYQLLSLSDKRNTKKKLETIKNLNERKAQLVKVMEG